MTIKEYSKNKYYQDDEIQRAKRLASEFYDKKYSPKLLRNGNLKLGKNVLIWDLPSIITCKYQCKDCYAVKAERIYKNTRIMRAFHYELIKQALLNEQKKIYLMDYITLELKKHQLLYKLPIVRIHSSGDLFNNKYLKFWLDIIAQNQDIYFYTYTKVLSNTQIDKLNDKYNNFNIVKSIIDKKYINYGDKEYLKKVTLELTKKKLQYYVCDYGTNKAHTACMENCTACLNCSNILFHKH